MLSAIALDDERPALEVIEAFAALEPALDLRATFTSSVAARAALAAAPVDLIFLDIDMPAISGLDFARELPPGTQVIFTTAHREYAPESYEVAATDYLVKPFTRTRFAQAVAKVGQRAGTATPGADEEPLNFRVGNSLERIRPGDIRYAEALDNYLRLHRSAGRPVTVRMTMGELLALLPEGRFVRIHRSYVVQVAAITGLRGSSVVVDQAVLPLGATHRARVKGLLAAGA